MLFPIHVVLLELVIDPVCSLVFEAEPSEPDAMRRPPRPRNARLFGVVELTTGLAKGSVVLAAVLAFYLLLLPNGEPEARAAAYVALTVANLSLALAIGASRGVGLLARERRLFWSVAVALAAILIAALTLPPVGEWFRFSAPSPAITLLSVLLGMLTGGWSGLVRKRRSLRRPVDDGQPTPGEAGR